jgi:uncharacterized protein YjgD (DUF1641 family)
MKGMPGKFWPKMLATSVGGMKITETMVNILMILFLFDVDQTKKGVLQVIEAFKTKLGVFTRS